MASKEAEEFGISEGERRRHIRISDGKANMAPLGTAKWIRLIEEFLPNGDAVACVCSWTPPDPFADVTTEDRRKASELAGSGEFREDSRSPEWFGYALAPLLNLDVRQGEKNDRKAIAKLKNIIKKWIKNGVLEIDERQDEKTRKNRKFIVRGTRQASEGTDDNNNVGDEGA
jgi:hypothetical protein